MGYRCGIGFGLAAIGLTPGEPHVFCDGCRIRHHVTNRHGMPYAWFLAHKSPPKWKGFPDGDKRRDYCPRCKPPSTPESGSGTGAGT